jgi:DNA repair protein RadC
MHPSHVFSLVGADLALLDREELWVILMNTRHQVMDVVKLYRGSVHTVTVRIGEMFRDAVRQNAPNVIIVHNHPSGDPTPSHQDVKLTGEVYEAGELLGVELLDHVIITRKGPFSLYDARLGFPGDHAVARARL